VDEWKPLPVAPPPGPAPRADCEVPTGGVDAGPNRESALSGVDRGVGV